MTEHDVSEARQVMDGKVSMQEYIARVLRDAEAL